MLDYEIVTFEKTLPPGVKQGSWFRYVIANGISSIEGLRAGSQEEVMEHARGCALRLNSRQKVVRW